MKAQRRMVWKREGGYGLNELGLLILREGGWMSGLEHLDLPSQHPTDEHDPSAPCSLCSLSLHPGGCHCWH